MRMDEPIKQDPIQPTPGSVSTTIGGAETAPISIGSNHPELTPTEPQVELAPGLEPPKVPEDLQEAGVKYKPINPPVSKEAQEAGVLPSIPTGPSFVPPHFQSAEEATNISKQTPVNRGLAWQATEWLKSLLQGKKQPSEA